MEPLERPFFARSTARVTRELIGHHIVASTPQGDPMVARITETEAYLGPEDPGSHATRGPDTQAHRLWGPPGIAYVYICYGIHQMLNVAAHAEDEVGAVLMRAAEPVGNVDAMRKRRGDVPEAAIASGPGNLAEALDITRQAHDGVDLTEPGAVFLARGQPVDANEIAVTGRIGLSEGGDRLMRFVDATSPTLSRPVPSGQPSSKLRDEADRGVVETSHNG